MYPYLEFHEYRVLVLQLSNQVDVSPYRPIALADSCKKNMAGKLFFVFASIRVPLVRTYVRRLYQNFADPKKGGKI